MAQEWWETSDPRKRLECEFRQCILNQKKSDSRGRVAVIDFSSSSEVSFKEYKEPNDLGDRLYSWELKQEGRLLIILEDLSRAWIELLGPRLHVPVSVFALHWASPEDHILGRARVPLGESPDRHFVLTYQQPTRLRIQPKKKGLSRIAAKSTT